MINHLHLHILDKMYDNNVETISTKQVIKVIDINAAVFVSTDSILYLVTI